MIKGIHHAALSVLDLERAVRKDPANEITWENRDRIVVAELDELCMPHPLQAPPR